MRAAAAGALLLACLAASGGQAAPRAELVPRGVTALGAVQVEGHALHVALDDAGRRMVVATVRYPESGRRDELHRYEIPNTGPIVTLPAWAISDVASVALSPGGDLIALACGAKVCVRDWETGAVRHELAARARPREIGALAYRPDVSLLVGIQRLRYEILTWDVERGAHHSWVAASLGERAKESVTIRFHGSPQWMPRWIGIAPDTTRVAAIRDDGTVLLWSRAGELITSRTLSRYPLVDPGFAPDGTLIGLHRPDGRLEAVDIERDRVLLSLDDVSRPARTMALLLSARGSYVAAGRPDGVTLHAFPRGEAKAVIPVAGTINEIAVNRQGGRVAVATAHEVTLWSLTDPVR